MRACRSASTILSRRHGRKPSSHMYVVIVSLGLLTGPLLRFAGASHVASSRASAAGKSGLHQDTPEEDDQALENGKQPEWRSLLDRVNNIDAAYDKERAPPSPGGRMENESSHAIQVTSPRALYQSDRDNGRGSLLVINPENLVHFFEILHEIQDLRLVDSYDLTPNKDSIMKRATQRLKSAKNARNSFNFGLGKRSGSPMGSRDLFNEFLPLENELYESDLSKRQIHSTRFDFGLGKRAPSHSRFDFGLGKRAAKMRL